jgi:peptidoglycan/xylan/chitin deacetylase (PgdA/CDA1 family)
VWRALDWDEVAPLLRGPYARAAGEPAVAFEVPREPARGFRFARLRAGDGWPAGLAPLDRLAAIPAPAASLAPGGESVLEAESPSGAREPLCVRAGGGLRWGVDPAAWLEGVLAERYVEGWTRPLPSRVPLLDYSRLPHAWKGALQRLQDPRVRRARAHAFPSEPLDLFAEELRALCARLAGLAPVSPWPGGRRAALALAHDLDDAWILDPARRALLRELVEGERRLGFPGAWYATASRVDRRRHADALALLASAGHEVGAHGWRHDGKLAYLSPARQERRMQRAGTRLAGLAATGIRTPWYARSAGLDAVLARHYRYDASVPNASSFFSRGSASGCASVLPYAGAGGLLRLPITLPPDTAFDPARAAAELLALAGRIVAAGGVVVATLHPQPHQSGNAAGIARWLAWLEALRARHGHELWAATPAAVVEAYCGALTH